MNEQHFDALPPLKLDQASKTEGAGATSEAGGKGQPVSSPMPAAAPMVDPAAVAVTGTTQAVPAIADDVDLIEKEWVEKAKQIVEQTKQDPYQQNQAMTKMKADYLKKRYNRDIKVSGA